MCRLHEFQRLQEILTGSTDTFCIINILYLMQIFNMFTRVRLEMEKTKTILTSATAVLTHCKRVIHTVTNYNRNEVSERKSWLLMWCEQSAWACEDEAASLKIMLRVSFTVWNCCCFLQVSSSSAKMFWNITAPNSCCSPDAGGFKQFFKKMINLSWSSCFSWYLCLCDEALQSMDAAGYPS